jgi:hypothetical protein
MLAGGDCFWPQDVVIVQDAAPFSDVVEAAGNLSLEEQEALVGILQHRVAEQRRELMAEEVAEADREFQRGACRPAGPDELMRELQS